MYTGTLIKDLMAAVERAERRAHQKALANEMERRWLFELQSSQLERDQVQRDRTQQERIFAGAA